MLFLSYRFLFLRSLTDALFGRNLRSQAIIQISCQTDLPGQRVLQNGQIRTLPSLIPTQCLTPARQKVYNYRVKGIYLCTETYIPFKREVYTFSGREFGLDEFVAYLCRGSVVKAPFQARRSEANRT